TPLERPARDPSRNADLSRRSASIERHMVEAIAWLATQLWRAMDFVPRYAAHATVLSVVVIALLLNRPVRATSQPTALNLPSGTGGATTDTTITETFLDRGFFADSNTVSRLADAHTTIPLRTRREIEVYTVQAGDTVQGIAAYFGLQPETLMWSNPAIEDTPDLLKIGQEVIILPIDGVYHEVTDGDTLSSIAQKYKVETTAITDVAWNNLTPPTFSITPGMKLIVADGTKPLITKVVTSYSGPIPSGATGTGQFRWPVTGRITQDYWSGHRAIDIAVPPNSPVYASDGGYVSFVGWTDVGYGYLVRIDHGNGFETWYAHNNSFAVTLGESVERGQVIAYSGSTGHSTGPHVHFEIRYLGALQNPRIYLP
ncbi:MAG TPA: M23 family metallopeptidase, partial [Anaerolineae bacterium]|nr:M23 family metallopeptidase [Anaerolineae bacterium]